MSHLTLARGDVGGCRKYILKLAHPDEDPDAIDCETQLLLHLESSAPEIPAPRVARTKDDRLYFSVTESTGKERIVRVLTYLDGVVSDSTTLDAPERFKVGQMLGRLRHATAGFTHPAETRALAWDVRYLERLRPLLDDIEHAGSRERVAEGMARFAKLSPLTASLRTQVLHNDFNRSNIVIDRRCPQLVTGVIDFGDAVRTLVAIDVSIAVMNHFPQHPLENAWEDLFAEPRDVLRGYLDVAELSNQELQFIPHLAMARVLARILITVWRASRFPERSDYILRNTEQAWAHLDWFLARPMEDVSKLLL